MITPSILGITWSFSLILSIKIVSWKLLFAPFWVYKPKLNLFSKQSLKTRIFVYSDEFNSFFKILF